MFKTRFPRNDAQQFNVVSVAIADANGEPARFSLSLIGIPIRDLQIVGSDNPREGSMPIQIALGEQRVPSGPDRNYSLLEDGYRPFSFLHMRELRSDELQPPKPVYRSKLANDFE